MAGHRACVGSGRAFPPNAVAALTAHGFFAAASKAAPVFVVALALNHCGPPDRPLPPAPPQEPALCLEPPCALVGQDGDVSNANNSGDKPGADTTTDGRPVRYVSSSMGADDFDGTAAKPWKSLVAALTNIKRSRKDANAEAVELRLCAESFEEDVIVDGSVNLVGGYSCADGWKHGTGLSVIKAQQAPVGMRVRAGRVALTGLHVKATPGASNALEKFDPYLRSSIALLVETDAEIAVRASVLEAAGGAAGTEGNRQFPTWESTPMDGANGWFACGEESVLYAGAWNASCPEGVGGPGGAAGGSGSAASAGAAGAPQELGDNGGDQYAKDCASGGAGWPGAMGAAGVEGEASAAVGVLDARGFAGLEGGAGEAGRVGQGGGGGRGGASLTCNYIAEVWGIPIGTYSIAGYGAGGGGGGAGGCGGAGGRGGGAGGSSIALVSLDAKITLEEVELRTSTGGVGGAGQAAQPGQAGGLGGWPGSDADAAVVPEPAIQACAGGAGGSGGRGGHGAGGRGGHSVGIAYVGSAPQEINSVRFVLASDPALGGAGGGSKAIGQAAAGAPGMIAHRMSF